MNAVNQIPEHQRPAFMASLEAMQTKDSLRMYNDLVERCYLQCVTSFRSQSLKRGEDLRRELRREAHQADAARGV